MGVSFNAAFYTLHICNNLTMNSIFKFFNLKTLFFFIQYNLTNVYWALDIMELPGMQNQKKHHPSRHFFDKNKKM